MSGKHDTEYDRYVRMFSDLMDDATIGLDPEQFEKFLNYLRDVFKTRNREGVI